MTHSAAEQKNGLTAISAIVVSAMKKSLVHLIRRVKVGAVRGREAHVGEHVGLGLVEERRELGQLGRNWSAMRRHCARAASAWFWAKAVAMKAGTMRRRSFRHAPARCA
ncbi:hypothetical protein [Bradyrhizobium sp. CCBAU 53421]|uniref:hypothetical protein n=1 Tax=Bradyrhizobium sp. CCBAU 53421 TaxID=1325120 RepID=UPI0035304538